MYTGVFNESIQKKLIKKDLSYLIKAVINMLASKCQYTANHCIRVSALSYEIGKALNLSLRDMQELYIASMLHDIGKLYIPNEILNKPGKLTEKEFEIIKAHAIKSYEIINNNKEFNNIANIVLYHHERYDGKGYPYGLKGKDVPFLTRIITVADAFDAMVSTRVYRAPMSVAEAVKELEVGRHTQFDGDIVNVLIELINKNKITLSLDEIVEVI